MKKGHKGSRQGGDGRHGKYTTINHSEQLVKSNNSEEEISNRDSNASDTSSPFAMSPWNNTSSTPGSATAYTISPTAHAVALIGSLVREEGHIYSLASFGELLYTGSDSKNIRVWKNQKEYSGFKSSSGLVKAIVISIDHRIFTGHQDGKVRAWRISPKNPRTHKRVGTLPRLRDLLKNSMNSKNRVPIRHSDAISALTLSEDQTLLYSGSWDRTLKVWRIADSKCMESVKAHNDAINVVVNGFGSHVLTGSADGTVKMWRRESTAKGKTKHTEVQALLKQESAVTALVVNQSTGVVYSGSSDGVVNLWEEGMVHGGVLHGHKLAVLCLTTTGSLLFSGSADKTICMWGREQSGAHICLSVLTGHDGPVKCLAMGTDPARDGAGPSKSWILYSGSLDKSVKIWKVSDEVDNQRKSEETSCGPPKFDMY